MFYQEVRFNKEECSEIIKLIETTPKIDGKNKYGGDDRTEVSFNEYKIEDSESNKWFMDRIKQFVEGSLKIKLIKLNNDVHILCYGINDGFSKHIDYNPMGDESRVYTLGLLLNTDYEGGNLIIYDKEKITLYKKEGNLYLFDTTVPHEVEKITRGIRYALIIHIKKSEIKKVNLF